MQCQRFLVSLMGSCTTQNVIAAIRLGEKLVQGMLEPRLRLFFSGQFVSLDNESQNKRLRVAMHVASHGFCMSCQCRTILRSEAVDRAVTMNKK